MIRGGFIAAGAFGVVALLVLFYATVTGAVDRAARHRADAIAPVAAQSTLPPQSHKLAVLDSSGP